MELDQLLFKKVFKFFGNWTNKTSKETEAKTIYLKDITSRLTIIARALSGENIDIYPAENEGGWKQNAFYLPVSFSLLPTIEENLNFYIYRIVYLSVQKERGFNWAEINRPPSIQESRTKANKASSIVLHQIQSDYPPVAKYYQSIKDFFIQEENISYWLYGKFMSNRDVFGTGDEELLDSGEENTSKTKPKTEINSKAVEEVEIISIDKKAQDEFVLTHNFEKVETVEEFSGVWRGFDGDDSLQTDEDALNDLNLKHLVRTNEVAKSIYQANFRDLANIAESASTEEDDICLTYKEWDYSKKRYKPDHCKVFLKKTSGRDLIYAQKYLSENTKNLSALRRKFAQIHQKRQIVRKQPDGENIDLDSLVDWYSDIKSGSSPSGNIYLSKRKKEPDLAILFLLDLSLSSDSYVNGNRVLDIEKQAVILFGEVLTEYNVDFAVSGFFSKTRNNCVYHSLKNFGEDWIKGKQNIGAIEPSGYTRIGPALRHSKTLIENHCARQKWMILLSDGKPNDYDKYEGKYGVADVKQALREMHEQHINTYAIAIESTARFYLPQMFGQNHYNILSHADMLISSLAVLYRRISNR